MDQKNGEKKEWAKCLLSFEFFVRERAFCFVGLRVHVCKCRSSRDEGLFLIRAKALITTISFACKQITPKPFSTFDPRAYFFATNIMHKVYYQEILALRWSMMSFNGNYI